MGIVFFGFHLAGQCVVKMKALHVVKCCVCSLGTVEALGYPLGGDPDNVIGPFCWDCYKIRYERRRVKQEPVNG